MIYVNADLIARLTLTTVGLDKEPVLRHVKRSLTTVLTPHGVKVVASWNDAVRRLASDPAALDAWADERGCLEDLQRFRRLLARRSRGFKSYARMMRRRDPNWRTAFHDKPYVPRWNKPDYSPRQSI